MDARHTQSLISQDGRLSLVKHFLPPQDAHNYFQLLLNHIDWRQEHYTIYGKSVTAPRLVAWYGDPKAAYTYSGVTHVPLPWSSPLKRLKSKIEILTNESFNSVLLNLYRNGQDSMGWHADQEKELGINPCIASLSLGEERLFKLRHNDSNQSIDINLPSGSLLIMAGELQHYWKHSVPKTKKLKSARINLTFRKILPQ